MSEIFVSYAHTQQRAARQLTSALSALGWTAWWDWNIGVSKEWRTELDSQLDAAACIVVLWSADSMQSEFVLYEARAAQSAQKLIQVLLEPLQPPAEFASFQAVNLVGWPNGEPFHAGFDRLRAAIRDLLSRRAPRMETSTGDLERKPGLDGDLLGHHSGRAVEPRARPVPVMLLPPPFRDLLDRRDATTAVLAALAERRDVALGGEAGSGKSAMLSHVGNLDLTESFHDGVVYLQAATQGENDLAHAVYEAFYDVPRGVRPSAVEMRRNLADKCALLLLDDVGLPITSVGALKAYAANSVWVCASEVMLASAARRAIPLTGLPTEDGISLFERTLSRPLSADERITVKQIVESMRGHPGRIEQAAGITAMHGFASGLTLLTSAPNLDDEDQRSRRVLAALACGGDVPLEAEQCAAIAAVDHVEDVLMDLMHRGLVQYVVPGFRLAAGLGLAVKATAEFASCSERATATFTQFAITSGGTPRRVARLAGPMTATMVWAAENGHSEAALRLARALDGPLAEANRWDAWGNMLARAHDIAVRAGDASTTAWTLHQQGTRMQMLGNKPDAIRLLRESRTLRKRISDVAGLKATTNNLRLLGWTRWMILLTVVAGLGVTALGAIGLHYVLRPIVAVDGGNHDFGAQDVLASARQQTFVIQNKGLSAVDGIDITLQGADANFSIVSNSCTGFRIARAGDCRFDVQFKPTAPGIREATIAIQVRGGASPTLVPLRGLGTVTPIAWLSRKNVAFGDVEIGSGAKDINLTLSNSGSAPLIATAISIQGHGDFQTVGNNCTAKPIVQQAKCEIHLRFTPREPGAKHATLVIQDNASGSPRAVALSGTGRATPKLDVVPGSLVFDRQEIGTQSAERTVRLRSVGTATVEIGQVTREGSGAFSMKDQCSNMKLHPDKDCAINLLFSPSTIETVSGKLVITSNTGGARVINLTGTGFGRPGIDFTPARIAFGTVKSGQGVNRQRVTITSVGSDSLRLNAPSIEGDGRFSLVNGCTEPLAPKAQCFVDIGFVASGGGSAKAQLVIAHNAAGARAVVTLSAAIQTIGKGAIVTDSAREPANVVGATTNIQSKQPSSDTKKGDAAKGKGAVVTDSSREKAKPAGVTTNIQSNQPSSDTKKGDAAKSKGAIRTDAVKVAPSAVGATTIVGWCCRDGRVTPPAAMHCPPGASFGTEAAAKEACRRK